MENVKLQRAPNTLYTLYDIFKQFSRISLFLSEYEIAALEAKLARSSRA